MSENSSQRLGSQGTLQSVLQQQAVDPQQGLSLPEVSKRQETYGLNALPEEAKTPLWKRVLDQFNDVMVIILMVAAVISGFLGDWIEALVIIAVVIVNAVLGVLQEGKAEKAVDALQKMASPSARVIREGKQQVVPSDQVVPGDIVLFEAGDIVPADCRLIQSSNLKCDESALTGESVPVEKSAEFETEQPVGIGDRKNTVFSSTIVTYGKGQGVAFSTGSETEMGKIATRLSGIQQESTPLQVSLNQLGKVLAVFCLGVVAVTFIVGLIEKGNPFDLFMTSVSLAVAAIPEGLAAVVTIVLALGMNKMAKRNAIVKRLLAVETLGSVNVICSDKTGTLTQNEMTVTRIFVDDQSFEVSGSGYAPVGEITTDGQTPAENPILTRLMTIATLCNDAELQKTASGNWEMIGDPTEGALLSAAGKWGINKLDLSTKHHLKGDLPFDSARKMMTVAYDQFEEGIISLTKGAPDIILERCDTILTSSGVRPLTDQDRQRILAVNSAYATTALRVLAFAYKADSGFEKETAETQMTFVGLMGMIDPARPEVRDAVTVCTQAGIRVVMITGDYKDTAVAIAKSLGLMKEGDKVLTGAELEGMDDVTLQSVCDETAVYARVSPEHKVRIVEALQSRGNIASMTGDGVNDAPALKRADIGVAMGITGTEVAKSAADMILTDDNFSTIVHAVEEGRVIYSNIRKFIGFLLSCNVGELLVVFITMLVMGPNITPLLPIQLLWLNLVTDSFPALALGREKAEPDVMDHPPRRKSDKLLDKEMALSIVVQALAIFAAVFLAFNIGISRYGLWLKSDAALAKYQPDASITTVYSQGEITGPESEWMASDGALTYAFITLILAELLRALSNRSEHYSVFKQGLFSNPTMNRSLAVSILLTLAVVYIPICNPVFDTIPLGLKDWGTILGLSLIPFAIGELFKALYHRKRRGA